jgi:hypothetical protein
MRCQATRFIHCSGRLHALQHGLRETPSFKVAAIDQNRGKSCIVQGFSQGSDNLGCLSTDRTHAVVGKACISLVEETNVGNGNTGAVVVFHVLGEIVCIGLDPISRRACLTRDATEITAVVHIIICLHVRGRGPRASVDGFDSVIILDCFAEPYLSIATGIPKYMLASWWQSPG